MQCPHFDVGECRSCPLMGVPYARQLADKQAAVLAALADAVDADTVVAAPFASAEAGFRNKAKLVVTGSAAAPRLGILDPRQHPRHHDGAGVDLRDGRRGGRGDGRQPHAGARDRQRSRHDPGAGGERGRSSVAGVPASTMALVGAGHPVLVSIVVTATRRRHRSIGTCQAPPPCTLCITSERTETCARASTVTPADRREAAPHRSRPGAGIESAPSHVHIVRDERTHDPSSRVR